MWTLRVPACAVVFTAVIGCGVRERDITFIHATDPHLFLPAAQAPATKDAGSKQEGLNEKALSDMFQRIRWLPGGEEAPGFIVLTGDFGVDPCPIAKTAEPAPTTKDCVEMFDPNKRKDQIERLAKVLATSSVTDIYLVAGNNDIANEDANDAALAYFDQFIVDLQAKIADNKNGVRLHNLTRCYESGSDPALCFADVQDTRYRLIGFPSYSFKNGDAKIDNSGNQARQFQTFRKLLDDAKTSGKRVLVLSHIPEIDDPYTLAQDRYVGKAPPKAADSDEKNARSAWSAWNVSKKLLDDWTEAISSDVVAGVLAGHLHDSHRETYRQPYPWSTIDDHRDGFRKLILAPPLAIKNQDSSPNQARGFSLVRLHAGHIRPLLFWYSQETGNFAPDPSQPQSIHWPWLWPWTLGSPGTSLPHWAVMLIALLTAYLTVVAIWQIPPAPDPVLGQKADAGGEKEASDTSPFTTKFGKTVIAGLGGLVAAEVAKTLGDEKPSPDLRWFYIICFIAFFFLLLLLLNFLRAILEARRVKVAFAARTPASGGLSVVGLTRWDTFFNLIQGRNQTMSKAFSDKVISQQGDLISVAGAIQAHIKDVIEKSIHPTDVRVNISVLSQDKSSVFYITRAKGSPSTTFPRESIAWVSVVGGEIRWYRSSYHALAFYDQIVLFEGSLDGRQGTIFLHDYYQQRHDDYSAFIMLPLPSSSARRSMPENYTKGAIHISFADDADFAKIWNPQDPDTANRKYRTPEEMLESRCRDAAVEATLKTSIMALGELLQGFNESIYHNYIAPTQR